jgi:hypothetical protein
MGEVHSRFFAGQAFLPDLCIIRNKKPFPSKNRERFASQLIRSRFFISSHSELASTRLSALAGKSMI